MKLIKQSYKSFIVLVLAFALILSVASAMFTDMLVAAQEAVAGTVRLDNINLRVMDVLPEASGTGDFGKYISNWNPGDINLLEWDVINLGNKSVKTRNTLFLYWDEVPELREQKVLYLYPSHMSDEEIYMDLNSETPSLCIPLGSDLKRIENPDGEIRYGYIWVIDGNTLDGAEGLAGRETGDATDPANPSSQHFSYKLAFSPNAAAEYMGKRAILQVVTEAMQFRNSTDWLEVQTDTIGAGYPVVPEYDAKDDNIDPEQAKSQYPYIAQVTHGAQRPSGYTGAGIPTAFEGYEWPYAIMQLTGTPRTNLNKYNAYAQLRLDLLNTTGLTDIAFDIHFTNETAQAWEIGNFRQYLYDAFNTVTWVIARTDGTLYYPSDTGVFTMQPGESIIIRGYTKNLAYLTADSWYAGYESSYRMLFDCWEQGRKEQTQFTPYADMTITYTLPLVKGTGSVSLTVQNENGDLVAGSVFSLEDADGNLLCFTEKDGLYHYDAMGTITQFCVDMQEQTFARIPKGTYTLVQISAAEGYDSMAPIFKEIIVTENAKTNYLVHNYTNAKKLPDIQIRTSAKNPSGTVAYLSGEFEIYALSGELVSDKPLRFVLRPDGSRTYKADGNLSSIPVAGASFSTVSKLPEGNYLLHPIFMEGGYLSGTADQMIAVKAGENLAPLTLQTYKFTDILVYNFYKYVLRSDGDVVGSTGSVYRSGISKIYSNKDETNPALLVGTNGSVYYSLNTNAVTNMTNANIKACFPVSAAIFVVKTDGSAWALGGNNTGVQGTGSMSSSTTTFTKMTFPAGVEVKKICGGSTCIALDTNGNVWLWGNNTANVMGTGYSAGYVVNPTKHPALSGITDIATTGTTFYALRSDGTVVAWGANTQGQCGIGTVSALESEPKEVLNLTEVLRLESSGTTKTAMAIRRDGTVFAWGGNTYSNVGNGTTGASVATPVLIGGLPALNANTQVSMTAQGCSVLTQDGDLYAWGDQIYTEVQRDQAKIPTLIQKNVTVGGMTSDDNKCALIHNEGAYGTSQLGNRFVPGTQLNAKRYTLPAGIDTQQVLQTVRPRDNSYVYLLRDGSVFAYGLNSESDTQRIGYYGSGNRASQFNKLAKLPITEVEQLWAQDDTVFAAKKDGTLWAWGKGANGRLGNAVHSTAPDGYRDVPVQVPLVQHVKDIQFGGTYAVYALTKQGTVWSWGRNGSYQVLGTNVTSDVVNGPQQLTTISDITQIKTLYPYTTGGAVTNYAVKADGTVYAWGWNGNGHVGVGTTVNAYAAPQKVLNLTNTQWIQTAGTSDFASVYAVCKDGTVWSWGYNTNGELGVGDTALRTQPAKTAMTDVKALYPGVTEPAKRSAYAVRDDGKVYAWGYSAMGLMGDGLHMPSAPTVTPVMIEDVNNVKSILTNGRTIFALTASAQVYAWGYEDTSGACLGLGISGLAKPTILSSLPAIAQLYTSGNPASTATPVNGTLARSKAGSLYVFGTNSGAQIAMGATAFVSTPYRLPQLENIILTLPHSNGSSAMSDALVWFWGNNTGFNTPSITMELK